MSTTGIPLDKAELLSALLEALLYGFSLLMFGATIWTLVVRRSTHQVNHKMLAVACALLLSSTVHFVIEIIRVMCGLILYRDTYPGGPVAYFSDPSQWTFVAKNSLFTVQTVIGDGVILYRCYVVWRSTLVMILPLLLWCLTFVTGIVSPYTAAITPDSQVFVGRLSHWITAFWATAFATNLLTTVLLVSRIWYVDRKATRLRGHRQSHLRPILHIIVDAGAIYSLTLLVGLICFVLGTNGQFVVLDLVTPIISITFYMVIIRVGLATNQADRTTSIALGYTSSEEDRSVAERRRRMQVHITTFTESNDDRGRHSAMYVTGPTSTKTSPHEIRRDSGGEEEGGYKERAV
ncbi:hypothetical protein L210DRAFT_982413 [Boletus edulis BED1]|uniref:Uncharacterized protein n=1 Tax=Boletus edulis BED1 TaxID=1328754 RepID=A0AAD4BP72_BOLED|nr:hypothetical protein L210DRAFT_982413 [Boletus edulis BED1]